MIAAQPLNPGISPSDENGPRPASRQLPLVAIAGSAGKSTVAWMVSDIFARAGKHVAGWLSTGVYIDGERHTNEIHTWERAVLAARAREIDVLIQELSAPLMLGIGLRPRSYQVGVVTTICGSDDRCHREAETSREIEAIGRLMDAISADGVAVGNADDILIVEQMERTAAERRLFALNGRNPALRHHLENGGLGAWVEQGWLVHGSLSEQRRIIRLADVQASRGGAFSFQIQNALAAICCAMAMGIEPEAVALALYEFAPDGRRLPGRCNVLNAFRGTVIVDSPRLLQSVRGLCRGVRSLGARRTIAMIGEDVEFNAEIAFEAARTVGSAAGVVILYGDSASGRLQRLRAGLAQADAPPVTLVFPDERLAVNYLGEALQSGDAALVLTDDAPTILRELNRRVA